MPTYEYKCSECGHTQEIFHKMNEKPKIRCEKCDGKCKKLIGAGSPPIFKGSGFYETDYRKPEQRNKSILRKIHENAPDDQLKEGNVRRKDL